MYSISPVVDEVGYLRTGILDTGFQRSSGLSWYLSIIRTSLAGMEHPLLAVLF
jgi:hypothetical protein